MSFQRKCVQSALSVDFSDGIQSFFSYVTPFSIVFQVIIGSGGDSGFFDGDEAVATTLSRKGALAIDAPPVEEKNVGFCF